MARNVEKSSAFGSEESGVLASLEHCGQDIAKSPGETTVGNETVELVDHHGIVVLCNGIDRNHAGCIAHTEHALAGEFPMDETGKSGEEVDLSHMLLVVENCLIKVRYAPAEGDVVDKQLA